jgi:single-strand DNA-binding protein
MARSVNKVILIGNLGKDAETKFTPSGVSVTSFTIATSRRSKDSQTGEWKDATDWHNVVVWKAENIATYLLKGKQVYVEGRLQTRTYDDKDGQKKYFTEVVCEAFDVMLLGSGTPGAGRSEGAPGEYDSSRPVSMPRSAQRPQQSTPAQNDGFNQGISDDDVPF